MVLGAAGIAIGLASALAVTRFLGSVLYGVAPSDPLTFAVVAVALFGIATLASWLPARRAAAVDPVDALHTD
jgi:ABC-type antimicrobial peptide transport system permease subunit